MASVCLQTVFRISSSIRGLTWESPGVTSVLVIRVLPKSLGSGIGHTVHATQCSHSQKPSAWSLFFFLNFPYAQGFAFSRLTPAEWQDEEGHSRPLSPPPSATLMPTPGYSGLRRLGSWWCSSVSWKYRQQFPVASSVFDVEMNTCED